MRGTAIQTLNAEMIWYVESAVASHSTAAGKGRERRDSRAQAKWSVGTDLCVEKMASAGIAARATDLAVLTVLSGIV